MAEQPATPKRPTLRAAPWSDDALERDAEVSVPRDVDASREWWKSHAAPGWQNLLDAEPLEEE